MGGAGAGVKNLKSEKGQELNCRSPDRHNAPSAHRDKVSTPLATQVARLVVGVTYLTILV